MLIFRKIKPQKGGHIVHGVSGKNIKNPRVQELKQQSIRQKNRRRSSGGAEYDSDSVFQSPA